MTIYSATKPSGRHSLAGVLTFTGTALLAFNDIAGLRSIGGGLLASPGWLPLVAATVLVYKSAKTPATGRMLRYTLILLLLGIFASVISLAFLPQDILGESPAVKVIKVTVTTAAWCTIFIGAGPLSKAVRPWLIAGLVTAIAIMTISAVLAQIGVGILEGPGFFHGTVNGQMRIRGTRFEASSLGAGLLCCISAVVLVIRGRKGLVIVAMGFLAVQLLTQSRGTWVTIAIVLFLVILLYFAGQRISRPTSVPYSLLTWACVLLTISMSFALSFLVTSTLWSDLGLANRSGMTSEATRSVWAVATVMSLFTFPFGMGFAGYLSWLPSLLSQAATSNTGIFYLADFSELTAIINSTDDTYLSPKTLPGILIVFFGWAGAIAAVALCHRAIQGGLSLSRLGFPGAPAAALAVLLVSFTYASSIFSWDQALVLGWLVSEAPTRIRMFSEYSGDPRSVAVPNQIDITGGRHNRSNFPNF